MQLTNVRITYTRARDAIFSVLRAQQVYSIERANEDEMGMRVAAAAMLMSLAESRFWMARLDAQVTESQFGGEIDKDVTDLRTLVTNAFNAIAEDLFSNNLDAINAAMDKSANAFNTLARSNQSLMNKLWPPPLARPINRPDHRPTIEAQRRRWWGKPAGPARPRPVPPTHEPLTRRADPGVCRGNATTGFPHPMSQTHARFSIGIDLGTTNSAMAYALLQGGAGTEVFAVPQGRRCRASSTPRRCPRSSTCRTTRPPPNSRARTPAPETGWWAGWPGPRPARHRGG